MEESLTLTIAELMRLHPDAMLVDAKSSVVAVGSGIPECLSRSVGRRLDAFLEPHAGGWRPKETCDAGVLLAEQALGHGGHRLLHVVQGRSIGTGYQGPFKGIPGQGLELLESLGHGVLITGPDGRIEWANERFVKLFGFERHAVLGRRAGEFLTGPSTDRATVTWLGTCMEAGRAFDAEIENATADGGALWAHVHAEPVRDEQGRTTAYLILYRSVDAQKRSDEAHQRERDIYEALLRKTGDGIYIHDLRTGQEKWLSGLGELFRLPAGVPQPPLSDWLARVPEAAATELQRINEAYRTGAIAAHTYVFPIRCYDGVTRWLLDRGQVLERDADGQPVTVVGLVSDIDAWKQRQQSAERETLLYRELLQGTGDGVWELDLVTMRSIWWSGLERLLGLPPDHPKPTPEQWMERIPPEAAAQLMDLAGRYRRGEIEQHVLEYSIRGYDGQERWVIDRGRVLTRDEQGLPERLVGVIIDLSAAKLAERQLAETERQMDALINCLGQAVMFEDAQQMIRMVNPEFCALTARSREELMGQRSLHLLEAAGAAGLAEAPRGFMDIIRKRLAGRQPAQGDRVALRDGRVLERDYMPVHLQNRFIGHLWVYRDVTHRERLLAEMRNSQDQLSMVLDTMDAALVMEGSDGSMQLANSTYWEWFGGDGEQPSDRDPRPAGLHRLAAEWAEEAEAQLRQMEALRQSRESADGCVLRLKDGRVMEYSHRLMLGEQGAGHLWVIHDVTARHALEREKHEAVMERERLLSAVASATGDLVHTHDVLAELPRIFERIGRATHVHRVYLFENTVDPKGHTIATSQRIEWNSGHAEPQIDNPDLQEVPVEVFSEFMAPMLEDEPFACLVRDISDANFRETLMAQSIISLLILPIRVRGVFWGFIGFDDCENERLWSANELAVLRSLASAISAAVERHALMHELDAELEAERATNRLNERIMGLQTAEQLHQAVVDEVGRSLALEHCTFHIPAVHGSGVALAAHRSAPGASTSIPGDLARIVELSAQRRSREQVAGTEVPGMPQRRACASIAMPVMVDDELVGVLGAACSALDEPLEQHVRMLQRAAQAIALKHLQLRAFRIAREQDEKYRRIIANMQLGLVEVDRDHRIVAVNQKFTELSRRGAMELIGKRLTDFAEVRHAAHLFEEKLALRRDGGSDAYELDVHLPPDDVRHWFISGAPSTDAKGAHIGSVNVILDITDRKRLEQELFEANIKARSSLQAKELFLANMSHEMRTPMNVVLGLCDALLREEARPEQLDQLKTMEQATRNLLTLTNDILELSRAGSGHLELHPQPISLQRSMAHVERLFRAQAAAKGLVLHAEAGEGLAALHLCDPQRLDQVLVNLVGNAVKFTHQGTVSIRLRGLEAEDGAQQVLIEVADTGMGMSEQYQERLFEPFSRDPALSMTGIEGSGLGLSICKHLVDRMGGGIAVESALGQGTTVVVSLKLPVAGHLPETKPPTALQEVRLPEARVLVVEDSVFNQKVLSAMLKDQPVTLQMAGNGAQALEMLCDEPPAIVLLDLRMPVMNGQEFLRILRDRLHLGIPVLALTAGEVGEELHMDGSMRILRKPYERQALLESMHGLLLQVSSGDAATAPTRLPWIPDALLRLLGGEERLARDVVGAFCSEAPITLRALRNAGTEGDLKRIGELAHRIRPSLAMLGFSGCLDLLDELVMRGKEGGDAVRVAGLAAVIERVVGESLAELRAWSLGAEGPGAGWHGRA